MGPEKEPTDDEALLDLGLRRAFQVTPTPGTLLDPEECGNYEVGDLLGRGGFGEVWVAEQRAPVKRRVAIKLLKPGMDSVQVLKRFEQERQTLARMNHGTIAQILDAGLTKKGRPFFVMEYLEGALPLTEHCNRHGLRLPQRIQLFQRVCAGVQHAHQKGVIHRDLKPANILVARRPDGDVVKIIDFGVARAVEDSRDPALTIPGQLLGTLDYMAPEQAAGDWQRVDTRVDGYSLGVVLYQLLTDCLPFDFRDKQPVHDVVRTLAERDPPRPSDRLAISPKWTAHAERVGLTAAALKTVLRRDLDWIVLKAIARAPEQRYATPADLAADLQRHLDLLPVVARRPTVAYHLERFIRRYRTPLAIASAVLVTALVGLFAALRLAHDREIARAAEARKVAEFDLLAAGVLYQRLASEESELFPETPTMVPAMEEWLQQHATLMAQEAPIRRQVDLLRTESLPSDRILQQTSADRDHARRQSELQALRTGLQRIIAASEARDTEAPRTSGFDLPLATAATLHRLAWDRVQPAAATCPPFEADFALACASSACAQIDQGDSSLDRRTATWTLTLALLRNGYVQCARTKLEALGAGPGGENAAIREAFDAALAREMPARRAELKQCEAELRTVTDEIAASKPRDFVDQSRAYLFEALSKLLVDMERMRTETRPSVERRLRWARTFSAGTDHPNAGASWREAADAIRAADGIRASTAYAACKIDLHPHRRLVPIGMNPVTKLWEFYDLRSAWDGSMDPMNMPVPRHAPDGSIHVEESTGLVMVLLPGGTCWIGAQSQDPSQPNYDTLARPEEGPPNLVSLSPFFISKYEMTQAQWAKLWMGDPGYREPSEQRAGKSFGSWHSAGGWTEPVTNVTPHIHQMLRYHELSLPTEAQWEYACRAGTQTPYSCGSTAESLSGFANVRDLDAEKEFASWGAGERFHDGYVVLAPVGSFRPNAFGLHDTHGNAWEGCVDSMAPYTTVAEAGTGLRSASTTYIEHVIRGGGYRFPAYLARSAARGVSWASTPRGLFGQGWRPTLPLAP